MTGIKALGISRNGLLGASVLLLLLGLFPLLSGCSDSSASQTRVEPVTAEDDESALTALQRGEVRREALAEVEKAIQAWLEDDPAGLEEYFAEDLVEKYDNFREQYAEEGKSRVREHEVIFYDVTQMSQDGGQVMVDYRVTDSSHFVDEQGRPLTEPAEAEHLMQFTVDKTEDGWVVSRMFGKNEVLQ